jgi:hypothetical protein
MRYYISMLNLVVAVFALLMAIVFGVRAAHDFGFTEITFSLPLIQLSKPSKAVSVVSNNQSGGITAQTVNINQLARYAWVDRDTWESRIRTVEPLPTANGNARFDASFRLEAGDGLLPAEVCIKVASDAAITYFWASSASAVSVYQREPDVWCVAGASKTIEGFVYFAARPKALELSFPD